jgi:hypothetical protein
MKWKWNQLAKPERWRALVRYIIEKIAAAAAKKYRNNTPPSANLQLAGSG